MPVHTDQIGKKILLEHPPQRIVSLVPSQTELLCDLGLDAEVIGITKFCVHPEQWFRNKTRIGGTKQLHLDKIHALAPDLIIANKEENLQADVAALESIAPVWTSDIPTTTQALQMIGDIGRLTDRSEAATILIRKISNDLAAIRSDKRSNIPVAYLIWKDPYMTVGGDTFIHDMLETAGFQNVFAQRQRYPEISMEELGACGAKLVLLSSEPYPFAQKHIDAFKALLPGRECVLVDGQMFSWYGSRMQHFYAYLRGLWAQIDGLSVH